MNRIKEIRERLGLTQEELGRALDCSQGNVGFLERGEHEVTPARARKLIEVARGRGLELSFDQVYDLAPLPAAPEAANESPQEKAA